MRPEHRILIVAKLGKAVQDALFRGVVFVALNDESGSGDGPDQIASYVSVVCLSEAFNVPRERIAEMVVAARRAEGIRVGK